MDQLLESKRLRPQFHSDGLQDLPFSKVSSDEEAVKLMNDSPYGLTASIWTNAQNSQEAFLKIIDQLETGTVFLNRSAPCVESYPLTLISFEAAITWTRR